MITAFRNTEGSALIAPAEQIIERHPEIIRKGYKSRVICLALVIFIPTDGVLIHIKINGKSLLRKSALASQFCKSEIQGAPPFFWEYFLNLLTKLYHYGIIVLSRFGIYYFFEVHYDSKLRC